MDLKSKEYLLFPSSRYQLDPFPMNLVSFLLPPARGDHSESDCDRITIEKLPYGISGGDCSPRGNGGEFCCRNEGGAGRRGALEH